MCRCVITTVRTASARCPALAAGWRRLLAGDPDRVDQLGRPAHVRAQRRRRRSGAGRCRSGSAPRVGCSTRKAGTGSHRPAAPRAEHGERVAQTVRGRRAALQEAGRREHLAAGSGCSRTVAPPRPPGSGSVAGWASVDIAMAASVTRAAGKLRRRMGQGAPLDIFRRGLLEGRPWRSRSAAAAEAARRPPARRSARRPPPAGDRSTRRAAAFAAAWSSAHGRWTRCSRPAARPSARRGGRPARRRRPAWATAARGRRRGDDRCRGRREGHVIAPPAGRGARAPTGHARGARESRPHALDRVVAPAIRTTAILPGDATSAEEIGARRRLPRVPGRRLLLGVRAGPRRSLTLRARRPPRRPRAPARRSRTRRGRCRAPRRPRARSAAPRR